MTELKGKQVEKILVVCYKRVMSLTYKDVFKKKRSYKLVAVGGKQKTWKAIDQGNTNSQ